MFLGGGWQTQAGMYFDTLQSAAGCDSVLSHNLTINPLPTITVTATATTVIAGDSTELTATGGDTYAWSPSTTLSSSTGATVTATPTDTTVYTVVGTSIFGCTGEASITIAVDIDDAVPFIVNGVPLRAWIGPGSNHLMVELGAGAPGKYEFAVFNTAGQRVHAGMVAKPAEPTLHRIDLGNAATGVYILNVRVRNEHSSTRVFKR